MIITIGGPPGSGKTTVATLLSKKLNLELVVIGEIFRSLAQERGYTLVQFGEMAQNDHSIDRELDKRTVSRAKEGDMILEGRLAGVMLYQNNIPAYKVWIDADLGERANRISERDGGEISEVINRIKEREHCERMRYEEIYSVRLDDRSIYDLIIDTSSLSPEEVVEVILKEIKV
ncbi:MAG: AAA family ATPase [Thermoplasmata archaeon]|nr:MAG: AAA family ATPase [Thermoplasmata archaeon]